MNQKLGGFRPPAPPQLCLHPCITSVVLRQSSHIASAMGPLYSAMFTKFQYSRVLPQWSRDQL